MPGIGRTNDLPRRGLLGALGFVRGREGVGFPNRIPGGPAGIAPLPSRLSLPLSPVKKGPPYIPGGQWGKVRLYTPGPATLADTAPYYLNSNQGFSVRLSNGKPIEWIRRYYENLVGQQTFIPYGQSTPDWTSNATQRATPHAVSPIPYSNKRLNWGGYLRPYAVDEQLFSQLTDRRHPWPIQKPMPRRIATTTAQPIQRTPYFYRLTAYQPAASYGQTTRTIISPRLSNLLRQQMVPAASGGTFGAY